MKYMYYSCLAIGLLFCAPAHSQFYFDARNKPEPELLWEAGIAIGAINCLTDIGGSSSTGKRFIKDINWNQTQCTGTIFISAAWQYGLTLRLQGAWGRISGTDEVLKNSFGPARNRYLRNLQFGTSLTELNLLTEWYPLTLFSKNKETPGCTPYLAVGAGVIHYNPQARLNNTWVDLRPLHTEGQGFKEYPDRHAYGPWTWCMPVGAGIKYDAGRLVNLRFELLYRFTGTDYLDDVSTGYIDPSVFSKYLTPLQAIQALQLSDRSATLTGGTSHPANDIRGNAGNRDAYFSCTLAVSLVLGRLHGR